MITNIHPPPKTKIHAGAKLISPNSEDMLERFGFQKGKMYSTKCPPCHSSVHVAGREKAERQSKQKKKVCDSGSTLSVYFDIHVPPVMDESWIHDWTHDWCCIFMTGRLGLINFARGGP